MTHPLLTLGSFRVFGRAWRRTTVSLQYGNSFAVGYTMLCRRRYWKGGRCRDGTFPEYADDKDNDDDGQSSDGIGPWAHSLWYAKKGYEGSSGFWSIHYATDIWLSHSFVEKGG